MNNGGTDSARDNAREHFSLIYWLSILRRRKVFFFAFFLPIFLVSAILLITSPKQYRATATFYFPVTATPYLPPMITGVGGDIAGGGVEKLSSFFGQGQPNLQDYSIAILTSRTMTDKVLDRFQKRLFPNLAPDYPRVKLRKLYKKIRFIQVAPDTTIMVEIQANDPELAKEVVKYYIQEYKKFENEAILTTTKSKRVHLAKQINEIRRKLRELEKERAKFETKNKLVDPDKETKEMISNLAQLEFFRVIVATEEQRAKKKIEAMRDKLKVRASRARKGVNSSIIEDDPLIVSMSANLVTLKMNLSREKKNKTGNHPDVKALEQNIHNLQNQLNEQIVRYSSSLESNLTPELIQDEVIWCSLKTQKAAFDKAIKKRRSALAKYPGIRLTYNQLNREIKIKETVLTMVEEEYERAKIEEERDGSQVKVLDYPVTPDASSAPNIPYSLCLAFIYASLLGLTGVFWAEYTHKTVDNLKSGRMDSGKDGDRDADG